MADKIAVVTGAAAGIGAAAVTELLASGYTVAALDRDSQALNRAWAQPGPARVRPATVDVTDPVRVQAVIDDLVDDLGPVEVVVNAAGVLHVGDLDPTPAAIAAARAVMDINYWGAVQVTSMLLPHLSPAGAHIAVMSSAIVEAPLPGLSAYAASKAALRAFADCLRAELAGTKTTVTTVIPGGVDTTIMRSGTVRPGVDHEASIARFEAMARTTPAAAAARIVKATLAGKHRALIGSDSIAVDLVSRISRTVTPRVITTIRDRERRQR